MEWIGVPAAKKSEFNIFLKFVAMVFGIGYFVHKSVHKLGKCVSSARPCYLSPTPMSHVMIFEQKYLNCGYTIGRVIKKNIFCPFFISFPPIIKFLPGACIYIRHTNNPHVLIDMPSDRRCVPQGGIAVSESSVDSARRPHSPCYGARARVSTTLVPIPSVPM